MPSERAPTSHTWTGGAPKQYKILVFGAGGQSRSQIRFLTLDLTSGNSYWCCCWMETGTGFERPYIGHLPFKLQRRQDAWISNLVLKMGLQSIHTTFGAPAAQGCP